MNHDKIKLSVPGINQQKHLLPKYEQNNTIHSVCKGEKKGE